MSASTAASATSAAEPPAFVVFGRDDANKPHASSFVASEIELATKAAALMEMRAFAITTDDHRALAAKLPRGKIFASGKGFVPFVRAPLYAELEAACPGDDAPPKRTKGGSAKASAAATTATKKSEPIAEATEATHQPTGWDGIGVGAVVLAFLAPEPTRWLEFLVVEVAADDTLRLRLCDWPNESLIDRQRTEVALMHPSRTPEPPLEPDAQPTAA